MKTFEPQKGTESGEARDASDVVEVTVLDAPSLEVSPDAHVANSATEDSRVKSAPIEGFTEILVDDASVTAIQVDDASEDDMESWGPVIPKGKGNVSTAARQRYAVEGMRQKSRVVAALLALFLGMFGVHKFYLGYNQAGFIMMAVTILGGLVTYGLVSLIIWLLAIIEAGFYISKSQSAFKRTYVVNQRDWL